MGLQLYNTQQRSKEVFEPIDPQRITMYVCGPTVYNRVHIGNATGGGLDTLFRLLKSCIPMSFMPVILLISMIKLSLRLLIQVSRSMRLVSVSLRLILGHGRLI